MNDGRARFRRPLLALAISLLFALPAGSRSLFRNQITSGPEAASNATNKLTEVPDLFDEDTLQELFTISNPVLNGFTSQLDLRGLPSLIAWSGLAGGPGQATLTFEILDVIEVSFSGSTLQEGLDQFEEWLKGNLDGPNAPQDLLTDALQALVRSSPVEPVAGNPNSMMTRMTGHDFMLGSEGPFIHSDQRIPDASDQTGIGLFAGYASAGPYDQELLELPFDHRFNLRFAPNWSILLSFPITATFTEGQWSAMGSLGLGFQYRPFDWWALTPILRLGAVGSIDVGAASLLYSGTLTSDIHFDLARASDALAGITLGITNQLGYSQTIDGIPIGDYELNYGLENGVFRNGGYLRGTFGRSAWGWRFYGNDTRWAGSDLFLDSSAEIGLALLRIGSVASQWPYESLSLSAAYTGDFDAWNGITVGLRGRF